MKPWLKLWNEFATDQVVQTMSEALQRRLIMVFCFMQSGDLNKLDDEELARAMGIEFHELESTKQTFMKKGFINKNWHPTNWKKRQDFDVGAAQRMRNMRRNKSVTDSEQIPNKKTNVTVRSRASELSLLNSDSQEEGDRGGNHSDEVANLAAATEARWPAQNGYAFVRDLCVTFDYRLVGQILNQAFDKDPNKLPREWIRGGCRNQFNAGWSPPEPPSNGTHKPGELSDAMEQRVREWEEAQRRKKEPGGTLP